MPSTRAVEEKSTVPSDPRAAIPAIIARCRYDRHAVVRVRAIRSFQATVDGRPGVPLDPGQKATIPWREAVTALDSGWAEEVKRA